MDYTIKQIAEKFSLTPYTLRYYEKEGLLPHVRRDRRGNRLFSETDVEWLTLICCLRDTGMSVSEIKRYGQLCQEGDAYIGDRRQMILDHKKTVEAKIAKMRQYLVKIEAKLQYYDELVKGKKNCCCTVVQQSE